MALRGKQDSAPAIAENMRNNGKFPPGVDQISRVIAVSLHFCQDKQTGTHCLVPALSLFIQKSHHHVQRPHGNLSKSPTSSIYTRQTENKKERKKESRPFKGSSQGFSPL